ncbi:mannose-1-phosphate guanylyltransferase [Rhodotorula toruloides]|uniref:mannose-1-phosphate guanylyltransferase n=1 Tax=Rhodotorula toruloides TaxID=5286 RepID=A0A511KKW9_RHOTO|nr:mannose-1-phosphate guanylyltransferase [Rhodotorula toruloides]
MASEQEKLAQIASITGCSLNQASFFLESAGGDVEAAVAAFFDNPQGDDDAAAGGAPNQTGASSSQQAAASVPQLVPSAANPLQPSGAYTLSGVPVDPLPAGWGQRSSARSATPSNPTRSTGGPRITGFRDLASSSAGPPFPPSGGDDDDEDEESEGRDPQHFFAGGAKRGSRRLAGGGDAEEQPRSSFFTGSAHTLGSDETPSTYIPDPNAKQQEEEEEDEEEEVAIRHLTFWQDGFSIDDGDLMRYEDHRELLAAIQAGRAPISFLKVKHDQPVELRIAERRNENWTRQAPQHSGPFSGSGNRLGSGSPYPESSPAPSPAPATSGSTRMFSGLIGDPKAPDAPVNGEVKFEVDRNEPATQVQIRLRNGDRMVATFNHTHTVGDIRRYINASRPGEASISYALQTTFPSRDLTDDSQTIKDAGLMGTRFRPLSLDVPKPLFCVGGRPIIWHSLVALSHVEGLTEVLLIGFYDEAVINPFIKDASRDFPNLSIRYLREYQSLGTAGGLYHYRDVILKGNPSQIFVVHSDIVCGWPLEEMQKFHSGHRGVGTMMAVKVPKEEANKFGCVVIDPQTSQARHYVEKPEEFLSDTVNAGLYLFDSNLLFSSIRDAMDIKLKRSSDDPEATNDEQLRLEQDVLSPLAHTSKLYAYQTTSPWVQIKSAASAIPANALILASYKTTNPSLLRRRSPTILAKSRADYSKKKGPEIVEPCFIHEDAQIDDTAKIGPNVSIGSGVKVGFGSRIKESIILDNTVIDKNACVLYSIVGEECKIGPWARVEGAPLAGGQQQSIAILGKDVSVLKEVHIRSCIVLPSKILSKSAKNEVLL